VIARWHLNKSEGNDTALRMMDSRAFRTATRSVLLVVADSENQGRGIVALDKVNATPLGAFPHCAKNCARHRTRWRRSTPSPASWSRLRRDLTQSDQSDQSDRYDLTGAEREPTGDQPTPQPVILHLEDVTLTAPKPLTGTDAMNREDHAKFGRRLRETVLGPDSDETEDPA
jgi:hypothetical protein